MKGRYDHKKIEKKWQERWEKESTYRATEDPAKEKEYLLIEFPYPSGDGLHVGHVRSWTALDVVARKHRAEGKNVLYPIGWDAFGLPAENYAIKTGIHPTISTKQNTDNFRRQIRSLGLSFDWSREINTTDPKYYKWTQWIFLRLYKKGLAYKAKIPVNWCPKDKIVLANEEVVEGCCERCGTPVEKREKEQWMLAITKYAQRLYDDLDSVDYIERAKTQQRNWIGPSKGAEINFPVARLNLDIKVFTTRPDTLFGATYVVLAPEHENLAELRPQITNLDEVSAYVQAAKNKTDLERQAEGREKTGVELKGVRATNPANKEEIPIFVADYVLQSYGTGAIMAVPAHDERDFEFAKKFGLPIRDVIMPRLPDPTNPHRAGKEVVYRRAIINIVYDPKTDRYLTLKWKKQPWITYVTGGVEDGEDLVDSALREIAEETGYTDLKFVRKLGGDAQAEFYAAHKGVNCVARNSMLLFELVSDKRVQVSPEEVEQHEVMWVPASELTSVRIQHSEARLISERILTGMDAYSGEGILINSGQFDGKESSEAKREITEAVGGKEVIRFKLRDWVFSRQRYWGEPIPMVHCAKDGWVPVREEDLPVELPQVEKYQPTDTGESPLADITDWVNTVCPKCGGKARRETDVMPNWAGSSWYYLRYTDPQNDKEFASRRELTYWTPVDWYNGGMEHTVLHLLYSRFWHKFLYDEGLVPTPEPYSKRTSHGLILAEGGEKMSKSRGNTVSPDEIVERFGADSLRLYEMFIGPFEQPVAWNTSSIAGVRRFLERTSKLKERVSATNPSPDLEALLHQTIKKIGEDIESLKMNTAVSSLMILLNKLEEEENISKSAFEVFLRLLAPFAPHLAHELAEDLSLDLSQWPRYDVSKIMASKVTIAVQVNGKVRGKIELSPEAEEEEALTRARSEPSVGKWLSLGKEAKAVYVPGKIVSFVVV